MDENLTKISSTLRTKKVTKRREKIPQTSEEKEVIEKKI